MKTWTDLKSIAMPLHMKALPRDARGYPVPWVAAVGADGKADFRVLDIQKVSSCVGERRCSICGGRIYGIVAFVGGPQSMLNRLFTDPGMHVSCAEYALKVCPFLAAPSFAYSRKTAELEGMVTKVDQHMSESRPDRFGLALCSRYSLVSFRGETYIHPEPWHGLIQWWQNGAHTHSGDV